MGSALGSLVGLDVGSCVGFVDGMLVGTRVGSVVGTDVGCVLGAKVEHVMLLSNENSAASSLLIKDRLYVPGGSATVITNMLPSWSGGMSPATLSLETRVASKFTTVSARTIS